jgi:hypothetical protein
MDVALVELAASAGADVVEGLEVRRVITSGGRVAGVTGRRRANLGEATFRARFVLAADGRDSTVARLLDPSRFRGRASPRFGVKAHYAHMQGFGGAVELHYFRGGYVGLHEVGGGRVNVCALIDRVVAGELPKDPERIVREIFFRNPAARARLERAERVSDWHAVGSLFFQAEAPVLGGVLLLGDAAGTIDPFAGEGMSMAFRSAEIAVEELARSLGAAAAEDGGADECGGADEAGSDGGDHGCPESIGGDHDSPERCPGDVIESIVCRNYAVRWRREFGRRIAICRSLGRLAIRPSFQAPMIGLLARFPALGRLVARGTRAGLSSQVKPEPDSRAPA